MRRLDGAVDPRAWFLWFIAASLPALLGRNPWPLLASLIAVIGVRVAWSQRVRSARSWGLLLRLAAIFVLLGVLFNALTVRAGDHSVFSIPDSIPVVGGDVTLNAVLYGLLGGLAILQLVLLGSTVAGLLDWAAIIRLLPPGLMTIAVAGSVAFAFFPQSVNALREIREAQMSRGHRVRGARDLVPVVVPVLANGLERAVTLSESLESRGFGAPALPDEAAARWTRVGGAVALSVAATGAYAMAIGKSVVAAAALAGAMILLLPLIREGATRHVHRTRYRAPEWTNRDTLVAVASLVSAVVTFVSLGRTPQSIRYEPYPRLDVPFVDPLLIAGLLLLLIPAFVAPAEDERPR